MLVWLLVKFHVFLNKDIFVVENSYLLQSESSSVSALFSTQKSIIKISRGVVTKAA